ncbi:MAG: hypothetical protein H0T78_03255 [Longispora sp.]|nr:hypothetical protein [Longispora sp. (in: high G+C Gram-positive bacteria)]
MAGRFNTYSALSGKLGKQGIDAAVGTDGVADCSDIDEVSCMLAGESEFDAKSDGHLAQLKDVAGAGIAAE